MVAVDSGFRPRRARRAAVGALGTALALSVLLALPGCGSDDDGPKGALEVRTLSSAPEHVSGGDVLVEVKIPTNVDRNKVVVALNGADVSSQFTDYDSASGSLRGLVTGLAAAAADGSPSDNTLVASSTDGSATDAQIAIKNHRIIGPILSGPLKQPWECRTVESGLGAPIDADCSILTRVDFYYRATDNTFKPLADPAAARPADLVTTTTRDNKTVPYVVRVESGTVNRSVYRIATLDNPSAANAAFNRNAGWNGRLIVQFGGGCGVQYNQGALPITDSLVGTVLDHAALSQGFAHAVSSALVNQQHCNPHFQGDSLMMLKERFIEHFGVPAWTLGRGGSGGAIQQYWMASLFPGLLDGLQPGVSFPDPWINHLECKLLAAYYPSAGATWTTAKQLAVEGYNEGTCGAWNAYTFSNMLDASLGVAGPLNPACGLVDQSKKYDPVTNPTGARCDVYSGNVNALGKNPATGFARRPYDNVGLQYGLLAVKEGGISVDEFIDLNQKIGGFDGDGQLMMARSVGDPDGIRLAYESGLKNQMGGSIGTIPILMQRQNGGAVGDIHDRLQDFVVLDRIQKSQGRTDNVVLWTAGAGTPAADMTASTQELMARWLDAIQADPAAASADKVVRLKPADAVDTCWGPDNTKKIEPRSLTGGQCNTWYPLFSQPLLRAGTPLANDVYKCQLKPVDIADYAPTVVSDAQKTRLQSVFPSGVCDWSKPAANLAGQRGTYLQLPLQ